MVAERIHAENSFMAFWNLPKIIAPICDWRLGGMDGMDTDGPWAGYSNCEIRACVGRAPAHGRGPRFTRGVPVLRFAGPTLRDHRDLVQFLVWCNPSNLEYASPALQADEGVVSAALHSPFYDEQEPPRPSFCVLRCACADVRASVVMDAVARSGYELEYAGERFCANAEVVALAGAPGGAAVNSGLSETLVLLMKADISVQHVHEHLLSILEDDACVAALTPAPGYASIPWNLMDLLRKWPELAEEPAQPTRDRFGRETPRHENGNKPGVCGRIRDELKSRFPLFWRVAPPVRDMLWPMHRDMLWPMYS